MVEIKDRGGVICVKGSKHVIEIVPRVNGMPEVYVDGELIRFDKAVRMDKDSDVYKFVTLAETNWIEPDYARETGGCSMVWIYEYDARIWINVGCYDDYIILEVDDDKVIVYEAVSTPWREEIVKYIEIEI